MSWSPPLKGLQNGNIQYYIVSVDGEIGSTTREVNDAYALIEQLHPHYTYNVMVAAVTIASGPFSDAAQFSMPQDGLLHHSVIPWPACAIVCLCLFVAFILCC